MKELSIEEKAKRYDEAIEKAKSKIKDDKDHVLYEDDVIEIFPELAESEDERIKKNIIATIHLYYGEPLEEEAKEMIAWLEKQGEQIDYNEELKKCKENPLYFFDKYCKIKIEGQKPAWSEDDEERYLSCLKRLSTGNIEQPETVNTVWLKSLKGRVQLQPKQEWSDEDNEHIKSIISTIECSKAQFPNAQAVLEAYNSDLIWLKSLRPQKQWKPSKEQLELLERVFNGETNPKDVPSSLKNILEQLKKLTE